MFDFYLRVVFIFLSFKSKWYNQKNVDAKTTLQINTIKTKKEIYYSVFTLIDNYYVAPFGLKWDAIGVTATSYKLR